MDMNRDGLPKPPPHQSEKGSSKNMGGLTPLSGKKRPPQRVFSPAIMHDFNEVDPSEPECGAVGNGGREDTVCFSPVPVAKKNKTEGPVTVPRARRSTAHYGTPIPTKKTNKTNKRPLFHIRRRERNSDPAKKLRETFHQPGPFETPPLTNREMKIPSRPKMVIPTASQQIRVLPQDEGRVPGQTRGTRASAKMVRDVQASFKFSKQKKVVSASIPRTISLPFNITSPSKRTRSGEFRRPHPMKLQALETQKLPAQKPTKQAPTFRKRSRSVAFHHGDRSFDGSDGTA